MTEPFDAVEVIATKRDKAELSDEQIDWVVDAYTRGVVANEQMSSLAMAILLNGMNRREISRWTNAMIASGERMEFSGLSWKTADKHSTGGVGDKVTLPLAPLVAACGVAVPQLSGRGLGHTGGTLDKFDAIPGYQTGISVEKFQQVVKQVGVAIIGQTADLAPADRRLYATRDVTATVESIPLITASILSKKLAAGLDALVMDVKAGSGAFMPTEAKSIELARSIVAVGGGAGVLVGADPGLAGASKIDDLAHDGGSGVLLAEGFDRDDLRLRLRRRRDRNGQAAVGVTGRDALGIERTAVIGNSFGGSMALALAIAHPDRPLGGHEEAGQRMQDRRLPRSAATDECGKLPGCQPQGLLQFKGCLRYKDHAARVGIESSLK